MESFRSRCARKSVERAQSRSVNAGEIRFCCRDLTVGHPRGPFQSAISRSLKQARSGGAQWARVPWIGNMRLRTEGSSGGVPAETSHSGCANLFTSDTRPRGTATTPPTCSARTRGICAHMTTEGDLPAELGPGGIRTQTRR